MIIKNLKCLLQLPACRNRLRITSVGALCLLSIVIAQIMLSPQQQPDAAELVNVAVASPLPAELPLPEIKPLPRADTYLQTIEAAVADTEGAETLRVLALRKPGQPQQPALATAEIHLLKAYARARQFNLEWLLVDKRWQLLPALQNGRGDLIAGQDKSIRAGMQGEVEFTRPWTVTRQRVVARRGARNFNSLADLATRQIAVSAASPALALLQAYAIDNPGMNLVKVGPRQSRADILRKVIHGKYDLAVVDSAYLADYLPEHPDLNVVFDLPEAENRVWAVHPDNSELRVSIDSYLSREALSRSVADVRFEDLPRITERRMLRVITYQSPANYYLADNGELRGFEYELIRKFAKQRGLRVEVVVAPSQQDMVRWLLEGRGDLIAASIPAASVRKNPRLNVSRPYNYAAPLVVGRKHDEPLIDARDLEGHRVVLPAGSPHKQLLQRYRQRGIEVEIVEAEPNQSIADILYRVAVGIYDLTVIDSHKSRALLAAEAGTKIHFPISEPLPHGWVMRADDEQLLDAVNGFINATYRSRDYNVLHAHYFEHPVKYMPLKKSDNELLTLGGELSPYDELVQRYAEQFGFDWRLIIAQMYQESRFDPAAQSTAGAIGLMQVLPTTADEIGITELYEPESAIHAGVSYLSYLYKRFEEELAFEDRIWLSLAAYNSGFQRVQQARRRTAEMGLDADRWFGNVEKAMLELAKETSCRCGQPVAYVREIRARYHNYVRLTQAAQYASRTPKVLRNDT